MKTLIVGLTGGIGSGKSTIAHYLSQKGIPVYIADEEAKKLLVTPVVAAKLKEVFGATVFTDGVPDRQKLAAAVFGDKQKLDKLNSIVHPEVKKHFDEWLALHRNEKVVIKEAAILFESGSYKGCDKVILVTAPRETRINRVMDRDSTTREAVLARMANQWDDEQKAKLSDYIINNENLSEAKVTADRIVAELFYENA